MTNIKIILGSNRPGRFVHQPGEWLRSLGDQIEGATFEVIDLAEVNLPFLDEPMPPKMGAHQNAHSKEWAKVITEADGFVFVAPEYNHSYTPVLKNAIDYLYHEWRHKPVAFASYGADAGGARAVEHLRAVIGNLGMYGIADAVTLPNYFLSLDENGAYKFTDQQRALGEGMLNELVLWADAMKVTREKLAS